MHADSLARHIDAAAPAAPLRKAALLLHSMCEADRRWMLAQVDPAQRVRLGELLEELRALDFPADPALLRASLEDAPAAAARSSAAAPAPRAASGPRAGDLASWSVEDAWRALEEESDAVVALVLAAAGEGVPAWAWEAAVLRRFGADRARAIAARRAALAAAATRPRALVEAARQAAAARHAALAQQGAARAPVLSKGSA